MTRSLCDPACSRWGGVVVDVSLIPASCLDGGISRNKSGESDVSPAWRPKVEKTWKVRRGFCRHTFQDYLTFGNCGAFVRKYSSSPLECSEAGRGTVWRLSGFAGEVNHTEYAVPALRVISLYFEICQQSGQGLVRRIAAHPRETGAKGVLAVSAVCSGGW